MVGWFAVYVHCSLYAGTFGSTSGQTHTDYEPSLFFIPFVQTLCTTQITECPSQQLYRGSGGEQKANQKSMQGGKTNRLVCARPSEASPPPSIVLRAKKKQLRIQSVRESKGSFAELLPPFWCWGLVSRRRRPHGATALFTKPPEFDTKLG